MLWDFELGGGGVGGVVSGARLQAKARKPNVYLAVYPFFWGVQDVVKELECLTPEKSPLA